MTITIHTTSQAFTFAEADDWSRDESGDVHVYKGDRTLGTFDAGAFVAMTRPDSDTPALMITTR
jgi:hypothetical protein